MLKCNSYTKWLNVDNNKYHQFDKVEIDYPLGKWRNQNCLQKIIEQML